ncbi:MAG: hypothetical protein WCS71_07860 [Sphaerochaetaceae bacterium]|jgi:hypothetical protein
MNKEEEKEERYLLFRLYVGKDGKARIDVNSNYAPYEVISQASRMLGIGMAQVLLQSIRNHTPGLLDMVADGNTEDFRAGLKQTFRSPKDGVGKQ